jgi:hypothetical protein
LLTEIRCIKVRRDGAKSGHKGFWFARFMQNSGDESGVFGDETQAAGAARKSHLHRRSNLVALSTWIWRRFKLSGV